MARRKKISDPEAMVGVGCKIKNYDRARLERLAFEYGQSVTERIKSLLERDILDNVDLWKGTAQDHEVSQGSFSREPLPGQAEFDAFSAAFEPAAVKPSSS